MIELRQHEIRIIARCTLDAIIPKQITEMLRLNTLYTLSTVIHFMAKSFCRWRSILHESQCEQSYNGLRAHLLLYRKRNPYTSYRITERDMPRYTTPHAQVTRIRWRIEIERITAAEWMLRRKMLNKTNIRRSSVNNCCALNKWLLPLVLMSFCTNFYSIDNEENVTTSQ